MVPLPLKRSWSSLVDPEKIQNGQVFPATTSPKKTNTGSNQFLQLQTSFKSETFSNGWIRCPRCDVILPGPQLLQIHFAIFHRPNATTNQNEHRPFPDSRAPGSSTESPTVTPIFRRNGETANGDFDWFHKNIDIDKDVLVSLYSIDFVRNYRYCHI